MSFDSVSEGVDGEGPASEPEEPTTVSLPFAGGRPKVQIFLEAPDDGDHVAEWATIDSGADRSLFPLVWAKRLGIARLLQRKRPLTGAAGHRFKVWSQPSPLTGHVVRFDVATSTHRVWGPAMALTPAFAKTSEAVLGMSDFFPYFVVTIQAGTHGTVLLEPRRGLDAADP